MMLPDPLSAEIDGLLQGPVPQQQAPAPAPQAPPPAPPPPSGDFQLIRDPSNVIIGATVDRGGQKATLHFDRDPKTGRISQFSVVNAAGHGSPGATPPTPQPQIELPPPEIARRLPPPAPRPA